MNFKAGEGGPFYILDNNHRAIISTICYVKNVSKYYFSSYNCTGKKIMYSCTIF